MKKGDIEYTIDADESTIADCADNRGEYINDAISETADASIEIYTAPLLEWAAHNSECVDDAVANGLVDMRNTDNIMVKMAQAGQYEYYTQMLYKNKAAIVLLYAFEKMDTDEIPDDLAEQLTDVADNIDRFGEIDDLIAEYNENKRA